MAASAKTQSEKKTGIGLMEMEILRDCGEASVMIMGMSFVVGSLTTVFVLVLLDMYRNRQANDTSKD